jgi:hypothetical protein
MDDDYDDNDGGDMKEIKKTGRRHRGSQYVGRRLMTADIHVEAGNDVEENVMSLEGGR